MTLLDALVTDDLDSGALAQPLNEVWVFIRADLSNKGDGSRGNPFNGSNSALFEAALQTIPENTIINLGPGIFRTNGGRGDAFLPPVAGYGWKPKPGWKIRGAGIFATTLLLEWTVPEAINTPEGKRYIISSDEFTDDLEVSNLTLDCNLQGRYFDYTQRKYQPVNLALDVAGNNILISRVRIINFGTRTYLIKDGETDRIGSREAFPIRIGGRRSKQQSGQATIENTSFNPRFENCIIEQPYPSPAQGQCLTGCKSLRRRTLNHSAGQGPFNDLSIPHGQTKTTARFDSTECLKRSTC